MISKSLPVTQNSPWPLSPVETLTSLEVNRRSSSLISSGFLFFNKMILLMLLVVTFPFEILRTHPAPVFLHQERHLESMLRWLTIFPSILDSSLLSGRNHLRIENIWNNKDTVTSRVGGTILKVGWHHIEGWRRNSVCRQMF
jgi:hypothetical protein